jgi:hypothetical protein
MFGELRGLNGWLKPEDYHLQASRFINRREYETSKHDLYRIIGRDMAAGMAHRLAEKCLRISSPIEHDYSMEFRADLFVFRPDHFWHIVEMNAMEIATRINMGKVQP